MNTISNIGEVNLTMLRDFSLHSYNQQWIAQNIPSPINGNRYNHLREDAPFYCNSSMGVMLNHFKEKEGFKNMIIQFVSQFSQDSNISTKNLSQLADWVVIQTLSSIRQEGSDRLDLQNVGWWMGIASYVACIISTSYKAQYEKIFIAAWSKYFTNETLF